VSGRGHCRDNIRAWRVSSSIPARFDGREATRNNGDMAGVALLNFWKGTIESDVLEFDVLR